MLNETKPTTPEIIDVPSDKPERFEDWLVRVQERGEKLSEIMRLEDRLERLKKELNP